MIKLTSPPTISRRSLRPVAAKWLSFAVFALLVYYAVFQVPFLFPPRQRLMSASYAYGFNNALGILATATLLGAVTLFVLLRRREVEARIQFPSQVDLTGTRPFRWAFAIAAVCYAALTFLMYLYDVHSYPGLMWETRHLLYRTWLMDLYGLQPYSEVAAEYGPLLTYAPSGMFWLLRPLGASYEQAYFAAHLALNLGGLWCSWYVLSRAVMPARARLVAFVLFAVAGFAPWMGINGVLIRYLSPFASLLFGHRLMTVALARRRRLAWWGGAVGSLLLLLIWNVLLSPEIGLAFAVAWLAYAVLAVRTDVRILVASLLAFVAATPLCWLFLPPEYYGTLLRFSQGANNLPLVPAPHLLFYLPTLFILVPALLARGLRGLWCGDVTATSIPGAFGVLCVALAPGALGRCDPPHVLLYGMGASMLLMIWLANISWRRFCAYAAAYAVVFIVFLESVNLVVFYGISPKTVFSRHPLRNVIAQLRRANAREHPDSTVLSALDRYPRLGLPFASFGDPIVERYLVMGGKLAPEYYVAIVGVYDSAALERKLRQVGEMEYLLLPKGLATRANQNQCSAYLKSIRQWFFYPAKFACRADPLDPQMELRNFIVDHYTPVEQVGSWVVLRRIGHARAPALLSGVRNPSQVEKEHYVSL